MSTSEPSVDSGGHGAFPPKDSGSKQQLRVAFPALPFREHSSVLDLDLKNFEQPVDLNDAQEVETATPGQRTNPEWVRYHQFTLTASNLKRVVASKKWSGVLLTSLFGTLHLGWAICQPSSMVECMKLLRSKLTKHIWLLLANQ